MAAVQIADPTRYQPEYRYLIVDAQSGIVLDELPMESVTYGRKMNTYGDFEGSVSMDSPKLDEGLMQEQVNLIVVERNGELVWSGPIWTCVPDPAEEGDVTRMIKYSASEYWSYMENLLVRDTLHFTQVDQTDIVRTLIDLANSRQGGLKTLQVDDLTTGVKVDLELKKLERRRLSEVIGDLTDADNGFDFAVTPQWSGNVVTHRLSFWYPRKSAHATWPIEYGGNLVGYELGSARRPNVVDMIGSGNSNAAVVETARDSDLLVNGPRIEIAVQVQDVSRRTRLQNMAQKYLRRSSVRYPTIKLTLKPGSEPGPGELTMGDWMHVRIDDRVIQIDERYRAMEKQVEVDETGVEKTTVTCLHRLVVGQTA